MTGFATVGLTKAKNRSGEFEHGQLIMVPEALKALNQILGPKKLVQEYRNLSKPWTGFIDFRGFGGTSGVHSGIQNPNLAT